MRKEKRTARGLHEMVALRTLRKAEITQLVGALLVVSAAENETVTTDKIERILLES